MSTFRDSAEDISERMRDMDFALKELLGPAERRLLDRTEDLRRRLDECPASIRPQMKAGTDAYIERIRTYVVQVVEGVPPVRRLSLSDIEVEDAFFKCVRRLGFIRAVVENLQNDHISHVDHDRGWWNWIHDDAMAFAVIRHILDEMELEQEDYERAYRVAVMSIKKYAPSSKVAVEYLTRLLDGGGEWSYQAALQLAELEPATPRLAERLVESASWKWFGPRRESYDDGFIGGEIAIDAFIKLTNNHPILDHVLRNCIAGSKGPYIGQLFILWIRLGRDLADFPDLFSEQELPERCVSAFQFWIDQPVSHPLRAQMLARLLPLPLVATWVGQSSDEHYLRDSLDFLGTSTAAGPLAWIALAQIVWAIERMKYLCEKKLTIGRRCVESYLAGLTERRDTLGDGENWLLELRGVSFGDFHWMIYSDWLEESGYPEAASSLRLTHESAINPANATLGLTDSGGEVVFYRWIAEWIPPPMLENDSSLYDG